MRTSLIYHVFAIPAAIIVLAVTVSALIHIFKYRRFGWILLMIFTAYLGAYLYGYIVASNPEYDDPPDISPDQRVRNLTHKSDH